MKRFQVHLILVLTLFLIIIMSFSIVQGDAPVIVQNTATMIAPYDTGNADSAEYDHGQDAIADSDWDASTGMIYAFASASQSSSSSQASSSWAYSYLQDAFQIIYSSNYNITFSFNYKGLAEIAGLIALDIGTASVTVDLTVHLIERDVGEIANKTVTIADYTENTEKVLDDQKNLVIENIHLEENHIYDWQAELRTEATASPNVYAGGDVEATADFFDSTESYQAEITQVLIKDLTPDNAPPTTTISLDGTLGENGWYNSSVTATLNATDDGYGVDYTNQRTNAGPWTTYTSPIQINAEGTNTIEFYSVDKAGNEENIESANIKIDTTSPTGQLTINNDDQYTNSEEVMLYISAQDEGSGLYQMRFRNEGDAWDSWIPYANSTSWIIKTGDGSKKVYAQFKDNAGNISPENADEIILDTEPPTTNATLSGTTGENNWYTSSVTVSLTATDTNNVDYTNQRTNAGPWTTYTSPIQINAEGTNTIEFYSVDKAGNKEATQESTINIDRTAPTGQITINDDDSYTSSTLVTLSLTYTDTSSGVSAVRYSNDGKSYTTWETPSETRYDWTLTSGEGIKNVYFQIKDYAGNTYTTFDSIILDTEPPSVTILINENDKFTNSTSVTLHLQYSDNQGVDLVRYSNDGESYTKWERPSETREWTLLSEDGVKTVYAQVRDWSGLNSNFVSDTIILDTIPPNGSIKINDGDLSTISTSVTITSSATDANGVTQMRLRNDGGNWSDWEEITAKTWILSSGLGNKTVFAQFKDYAGWVSSECNASIELVAPEPSPSPTPRTTPNPTASPSQVGNLIVYVKDENNLFISGATVTSNTQPAGQPILKGTTDSKGTVIFNNVAVGSYSFSAYKGVFGSDEIEVNVRSQQTSTVTITLQRDQVKPTVSVTINEKLGTPQQVFTVTGEDDAQGSGIAKITLYVDEVPVAVWTTAGTHNYDEGIYAIGTHAYYVEATDNAGNSVRNPTSGYFEFTVVEGAYVMQTELWKVLGVIVVLANGTALLFFSLKRKKTKT